MKISTILIEADQSQQTYDRYLAGWDSESMKADMYCAVGKLACVSGSVNRFGDIDNERTWLKLKFKIPFFKIDKNIKCMACVEKKPLLDPVKFKKPHVGSLPNTIVHLNDDHRLTYKQIGRYMKRLGF